MTERDRARPIAILAVSTAEFAMLVDALGVASMGPLVRNVAAGLLVFVLVGALLRSPRVDGGAGLPFAFALFSTWVTFRVIYDSGFTLIPLMLVLWFPFTFFVTYKCRTRMDVASRIVSYFTLVGAAIYLVLTLRESAPGPQAINAIFYVVLALPFVLAVPSPRLRLLGLGAIVFAAAVSDKRTAVIALVFGLLAFGLASWARGSRLESRGRPGVLGAGLVIFMVLGYMLAVTQFKIDILEKFARISEDQGSGRSDIYRGVLEKLALKDLSSLLLGAGQDGVASATGGISAHNDFLEVSFDFGLVGLGLFLMIIAASLSGLLRLISTGNHLAGPWAAALAVFATMTMLSHVAFVPTYVALLSCFWGLAAREMNTGSDTRVKPQELRSRLW